MSLLSTFEETIAAFKAKRADDYGLIYRPFYLNVFLKSFLEYAADDSRLIERFLELEKRLQFISVPRRGANLRNTCGAHKIDMQRQNMGKSGGYRIIYYPHIHGEIHFIMIFSKADQENLTPDEEKLCCAIIEEIKRQKTERP